MLKARKSVLIPLIFVLVSAVCITLSLGADGVAAATVADDDIVVIAGRELTDGEITSIKDGFATKASGLNLGTAGGVTAARELLLYVDYTDGSEVSRIVYNFAMKQYFVVDSGFNAEYAKNDNFRRLGAPVTEKGTYTLSGRSTGNPITAGEYTAQIFEKGLFIQGDSEIYMYVGAVEKTADGYVLHPVIDDQDVMKKSSGGMEYFGNVDGEMHPLKDADIISSGTGAAKTYKLYANYKGCCVYVLYDAEYNIKTQLVYAARNYFIENDEYVTGILPAVAVNVNQMICDGANPVDSAALSYYVDEHADGTQDKLIALFADCYSRLLSDGYSAGYRCSTIKVWDLVVLDMRFGDGTTGFDTVGSGARERMTCLVYNPVQNKVFAVRDSYFTLFKSDSGIGRRTLGYPESDILYDKTIDGITFAEIQLFKNGYIYRTAGGSYVGMTGYAFDAETNSFSTSITAPEVPDRYGDEVEKREKDGTVYINYMRGAIKCQLTSNKSKYRYEFFHGRNFDFSEENYEAKLLDMDELFNSAQLINKGAMPYDSDKNEIDFESVIKPLLIAKYTELYEAGYFCGFVEEEFKGAWNSIFAQQFVVGDSTSMIFGDERPNVSALAYNPNTGKVYLLKNDVIKTWQANGNYNTAGAPTSDEYQVEGCDFWFQTFDYGMTIRNGNLIIFTEQYDSPEDYVTMRAAEQIDCPTHGGDQSKGYIG